MLGVNLRWIRILSGGGGAVGVGGVELAINY